MEKKKKDSGNMVRIDQYQYVHILNCNTNVTRLVLGPRTYFCLEGEKIVAGPADMISIPPMHYCVVENPILRDSSGEPVLDASGQVKLQLGDKEYRFHQNPFPLYPGEELQSKIEKLPVLKKNEALCLRALVDHVDSNGVKRTAGEDWHFEGPAIYYPRKEELAMTTREAITVLPNTGLRIEAAQDFIAHDGTKRVAGERWMFTKPGAYLIGIHELVTRISEAFVLTDKVALHLQADEAHVDQFGRRRRRGDEWLVTSEDTDSYICGVYETVVGPVSKTVLTAHQYCVIENPVDSTGKPQSGKRKLVRGECSFFLQPGESLLAGVQDTYVLEADEGLLLVADEKFVDVPTDQVQTYGEESDKRKRIIRNPGDQWMIHGPVEYIPPLQVRVLGRRKAIPLDHNEGIYVRNMRTGHVRTVIGHSYLLNHEEELWSKKLPPEVIELLAPDRELLPNRHLFAELAAPMLRSAAMPLPDLTRVVTFRVPHNAAVQIYDYGANLARVEFGPTLVMLGPEEQFTKLSLSGGRPKRPNMIRTLCLMLGPDFFTDIVQVETADHARLSLQLSYNWQFIVPSPCPHEEAVKLFSVPDFIGDASKTIASRIRGAVAAVNFDDFHKKSARIIRFAVFGTDESGRVKDYYVFPQNNLSITNVDVQSVEPVDQRTRDALQKSVQLAIEITTNSQEAAARHEAERLEQEARGRLERQKIEDESAAEVARRALLETRVQLAALESTGQATADAKSRADAARIEGEAAVELAKLRAEASAIETDAELKRLKKAREAELAYLQQVAELKVARMNEEMRIDVERFHSMVKTIGADTIQAMVSAGPEHNVRMLDALGLQSTLITDGTTPVNLLSTAYGLIGQLTRSNPIVES